MFSISHFSTIQNSNTPASESIENLSELMDPSLGALLRVINKNKKKYLNCPMKICNKILNCANVTSIGIKEFERFQYRIQANSLILKNYDIDKLISIALEQQPTNELKNLERLIIREEHTHLQLFRNLTHLEKSPRVRVKRIYKKQHSLNHSIWAVVRLNPMYRIDINDLSLKIQELAGLSIQDRKKLINFKALLRRNLRDFPRDSKEKFSYDIEVLKQLVQRYAPCLSLKQPEENNTKIPQEHLLVARNSQATPMIDAYTTETSEPSSITITSLEEKNSMPPFDGLPAPSLHDSSDRFLYSHLSIYDDTSTEDDGFLDFTY